MTEKVIRACELPLRFAEDETWKLLLECWSQASMLANWTVHTLARHDIVRLPDMDKLPPMPVIDLYATAFGRKKTKPGKKDASKTLHACDPQYTGYEFFGGAMQSANIIMNDVLARYKRYRFDIVWRRVRSLDTYRGMYPWPIHGKAWGKARLDENGKPSIEVSLPGGKVRLELRGGPEFHRQMKLFKEMVELDKLPESMRKDELGRPQMEIRYQRGSMSSHRQMTPTRQPGRVMVKMLARVTPREDKEATRCLVLTTDPGAFWVAEIDQRQAWVLNADHVRRGIARHQEHLSTIQRLAQDAKAESRIYFNRHSKQQTRLEALVHKNHNRICSWTHESAAHVINFAVRQKVCEIFYLDKNTGFIEKFPWRMLHDKLADKAKLNGINFYSESVLTKSKTSPNIKTDEIQADEEASVDIEPTKEDDKWTRVARLRELAVKKLISAKNRKGSHPDVSAI